MFNIEDKKGGDKMDEKNEDKNKFNEPSIEDFLFEEEDPDRERKNKRRKLIIRSVTTVIAFIFLISSFSALSSVFNLPAFQFLKTSFQLSQKEEIQQYKKAVVSIEGSNIKGTGFNVAEDGLIITNFHVIEKMKPIIVYFSDGQVKKATLIHGYPEVDLAFLEIEGENLPVLPLAKENSWNKGDAVLVIGNPLAFYQIANKGEMIGLRGVKTIDAPVLAMTAPIYRGNSGSPVISEDGKVVGVVFATTIPRIMKGEQREGLAIPIEEVVTRLP